MFWHNPQWLESTRNFFVNSHNYDKNVKVLDVDFNKPWWHILIKQKGLILILVLVSGVSTGFTTLVTLFLAIVIQSGNYIYFLYLFLGRIFIGFLNLIINYRYRILIVQTSGSLQYWATNFFLTVDPVAHSTRSSGTVISKVGRLKTASESFIELTIFTGFEYFITIASTFVAIFIVNWQLGLINVIGFILSASTVSLGQTVRNRLFHKVIVKAEDQKSATQIENLHQISYIRATFATTIQDIKAREAIFKPLNLSSINRRVSAYISFSGYVIYLCFFLIFGWILFQMINKSEISPILALSIASLYLGLVGNIRRLGNDIQRIIETSSDLVDTFKFIREYGVRSYPVLEGNQPNDLKN